MSLELISQLFIEPTNLCNSNCIFCGYRSNPDPKVVMSQELFARICEEYRTLGGTQLNLTPYAGEILTDPGVLQKIRFARDLGFSKISTYTNLVQLDQFGVQDFLTAGITDLAISVAPLNADSYKKIFRTNAYARVLANLKNLLQAFHASSTKTIQSIHLSFRSDRPLEQIEELAAYQTLRPLLRDGVFVSCMTEYDSWMGLISQEDLLPGMTLKSASFSKPVPCDRLFMLKVKSDGTLRACGCRCDYSKPADPFKIGIYGELSLSEASHSPVLQALRDSFRRGCPPDECRRCAWYENFRYDGGRSIAKTN